MAPSGWLNLESATSAMPDNQLFENDSAFSFLGLTRMQRIYGFAICSVIGFAISLLGTIFLLIPGFLGSFIFLYPIGIIVSLIGTGFLIGFFKQLKLMFKPVRVAATLVFFAAMIMVFISAFIIGNDILCIVFVIVEYIAYTWYCLSYIPYARTAILKMIGMS